MVSNRYGDFVFAVWESLLTRISDALGIQVPSNALFLLALMFLFAIVLHFSPDRLPADRPEQDAGPAAGPAGS